MSKASKPSKPDVSSLYRLAPAAEAVGIHRSTLKSAVERGELRSYRLGDGLPVVTLVDAKAWARKYAGRGVGRPAG